MYWECQSSTLSYQRESVNVEALQSVRGQTVSDINQLATFTSTRPHSKTSPDTYQQITHYAHDLICMIQLLIVQTVREDMQLNTAVMGVSCLEHPRDRTITIITLTKIRAMNELSRVPSEQLSHYTNAQCSGVPINWLSGPMNIVKCSQKY